MNPFRNDVGTLNEILFEKRNQSYGAYVIRKSYNNTVLKSLLITGSVFLLGFWGLSVLVNTKTELPSVVAPNIIPDITVPFDATKDKIKKHDIQKPPATAPNKPTTQNTLGTTVKDSTAKETDTKLNTDLRGTGTNTLSTTPGTGTNTTSVGPPTNTLTTGGGSEAVTGPDVLPSMPGLANFLQENLIYPYEAKENRVSGKVWVNFIIDEQGKIIEAKVIKKVGFGCDEEALRVIKLMPKWKPGLLEGKPVKVSFNQPIIFRMD